MNMKKPKTAVPFPGLDKVRGEAPPAGGYDPHETRTYWKVRWLAASQKERIALALDLIADAVLAYRAAARTKKAKKRQRARRKVQRESSI